MRSVTHNSRTIENGDESVASRPRILVAVEGGGQEPEMAKAVASLARSLRAEIAILHVCQPKDAIPDDSARASKSQQLWTMREAGRAILRRFRRHLPASAHVTILMAEGTPSIHIVRAAERWRANLIVLGRHTRGKYAKAFIGSTTVLVLKRAPCPVMTAASDHDESKMPAANHSLKHGLPSSEK